MSVAVRKCFFSKMISLKTMLPKFQTIKFPVCSRPSVRLRSSKVQTQQNLDDIDKVNNQAANELFAKINEQIRNKTHGRLFAVVQIEGLQYKITTEDLLVIQGPWAPKPGDKIRLEKVLLVGSSDFTLLGRPILPLDQVSVYATVIEKTLSHTYPIFKFLPRKNHTKLNFLKFDLTYLRITGIHLNGMVNELGDIDGLKNRIF